MNDAAEMEHRARHERDVPTFTEELRALCERYGFTLIAEPIGEDCGVELSVDWGWPIATSGRWSSWVRFPDAECEAQAIKS